MAEAENALKKMAAWATVIILCCFLKIAEYLWLPMPKNVVSTFYLPVLSLFLIYYFNTRIVERNGIKFFLMSIAWLIFAFVCLREIKYNTFIDDGNPGRWLWYLYYVPILLIPLCSFCAAVMINARDRMHFPSKWRWILIITALLVLLVMTNDLHQQVFGFRENFENWGEDYSHRWGFFMIWIWHYALYLAALTMMVMRCRLTASRQLFWIPIIPLAAGGILMLGEILGYELRFAGVVLVGFPEIFCFSAALFWEGCISIGLIPTNEDYRNLLKRLSLPVWITSEAGKVIYKSDTAQETDENYTRLDGDVRLDENTLLHGRKIPGGYGIWQEDISGINKVRKGLQDLEEQLKEESVLIRLENKRKEEQAHIDQQNALYDQIALMTRSQLEKIRLLAKEAEETEDELRRKQNASLICFYGAYIKRMSNMILSENRGSESAAGTGELFLAIQESFRYLEKTGVKCLCGQNIDIPCEIDRLISCYRIVEEILESNLNLLKGVFATFYRNSEGLELRLTLESLCSVSLEELPALAAAHDMAMSCIAEDEAVYIRIFLIKSFPSESFKSESPASGSFLRRAVMFK